MVCTRRHTTYLVEAQSGGRTNLTFNCTLDPLNENASSHSIFSDEPILQRRCIHVMGGISPTLQFLLTRDNHQRLCRCIGVHKNLK